MNLFCLVLYNLIYSSEQKGSWIGNFLDSFINSLMYALVLFLNLVLIDSQTDKINTNISASGEYESPKQKINKFYMPKTIICFAIFITLYFFMNTHSIRMRTFITEMNRASDSVETTSLFAGFDITDIICLIMFSIYAFLSIRFSIEAFSSANKEYIANRTRKNYNLYNLIFAESEFTLKSDQ
jgi:hypothetical protein